MNVTITQILCFPFGGMFNLGLLLGLLLGWITCNVLYKISFERAMRNWFLCSALLLIPLYPQATPTLVPYIKTQLPNGYTQFETRLGGAGWWRDDNGLVHETVSELTPSDSVWDIENISAPHKVYAATDAPHWRVDPPAGESAGFEIAFSTVSLCLFDAGNIIEKSINWTRVPLNTTSSGPKITYSLFDSVNLFVLSTPEGYKTNFHVSNPALIPDPAGVSYFGAGVDLSNVYFATRYSVSKWPDSAMMVDGEPYGPGSITDGYSATFGDDLWMLPTKAYRNVKDFNGDTWVKHEDESYVYYVFDRLAQEILVLAPYTLFVGAQNVVIDPTTWTSGRTSSDDATNTVTDNPTTNYGTATTMAVGYNVNSTELNTFIRFASLPSVPVVSNVSATLVLMYQGQGSAGTLGVTIGRVLRAWVESQATLNIYSTGNNWGTAGGNNSTTDYDGAGAFTGTLPDGANFALSNNSTLNSWCDAWIEGAYTNNGIYISKTTGSGTSDYKSYHTDDAASSTNRPYLSITYTTTNTLPILPTDTTKVGVEAGSVLARIVVDATSTFLSVADIANDVTADLVLDTGTHVTIGNGAGATDNWDVQAAADLVGGGTMFVLSSNYALSDAAGVALYFKSSLTAETSTRGYGLSPSGGGSVDLSTVAKTTQLTAVHDAIQSVTTNGTWGLPILKTRFDSTDQQFIAANVALQSVTTDATYGLVALETLVDNIETTQDTHTASLDTIISSLGSAEQIIAANTMLVSDTVGDNTLRLCLPMSNVYEPGQYIELLALSTVQVTPSIDARLRNNENGAVASWNPTAEINFEHSLYSELDIDSVTMYSYIIRYPITTSDVSSVTGPAQLIISADTPIGTRHTAIPVRLIKTQALEESFDTGAITTGLADLVTNIDLNTLTNTMQIIAKENIDGATIASGTQDVMACYIPAGQVAATFDYHRDESGNVIVDRAIYWSYGLSSLPDTAYPLQYTIFNYGALTYTNGYVSSCTESALLLLTGQDPDSVFAGVSPTKDYGD